MFYSLHVCAIILVVDVGDLALAQHIRCDLKRILFIRSPGPNHIDFNRCVSSPFAFR